MLNTEESPESVPLAGMADDERPLDLEASAVVVDESGALSSESSNAEEEDGSAGGVGGWSGFLLSAWDTMAKKSSEPDGALVENSGENASAPPFEAAGMGAEQIGFRHHFGEVLRKEASRRLSERVATRLASAAPFFNNDSRMAAVSSSFMNTMIFHDGRVVHFRKNVGGAFGRHGGINLGQFFQIGGFLFLDAHDILVEIQLQLMHGLGWPD